MSLSILSCYSTLHYANRCAKAEVRRLHCNAEHQTRLEPEESSVRGCYVAIVWLYVDDIERVEISVKEIECQTGYDPDDFSDGYEDDDNNEDDEEDDGGVGGWIDPAWQPLAPPSAHAPTPHTAAFRTTVNQ